MQIEKIHSETLDDSVTRWEATVRWEDCDRTDQTVFVSVPHDLGSSAALIGDGFVLMCLVYAWHHGEHRIQIDAPVDPWLRARVGKAIDYLNFWFGREHMVLIEPTQPYHPCKQSTERGCALFLSGGLDSMSSLVRNCVTLPEDHPMRFRYGLVVDGLDMAYIEGKASQDQEALTEQNYLGVKKICDDFNIVPARIRTNIRSLDENNLLYAEKAHGAILAGLAHFLSGRLNDVNIASTNDLRHAAPWGSSPLLDVNYSSTTLRIHHDSEDLSRLEKLRIVSANQAALQSLRVCPKVYALSKGHLNCGECEKCLRTMLEFVALGIDYGKYGFPAETALEDLIRGKKLVQSEYHASQIKEIVKPLKNQGRLELASACQHALKEWTRYSDWKRGESLGGLVKKLARRVKRGVTA